MKLSIKERIKTSELLADQVGSFFTMKLVRKAMENLSLSEEEIKEVGYVTVPNGDGGTSAGWSPDRDPMKEIEFGETVLSMIQTKLKRLSETNQLNGDQVDLYEKLVEHPSK